MGGGVNPLEWVLPPVALTHMAVNTALNPYFPKAKIIAPGSPTDKAQTAQDDAQKLGDQQKSDQAASAAAAYLAEHPGPQTPEEEEAARRRAQYAGASNLGTRRASQVLGSDTSAVGV